MSLPPCLMRLKIVDSEHRVNLWLPLFLAWIILAALYIVLSPLIAILILILWPFGWGEFLLMIGPTIYSCLCALRELQVDIRKGSDIVMIYFI
jgi:hypothetical protein